MKVLKARLDALARSKLFWVVFATVMTIGMFNHPFKDKEPEMAFWIAFAVLAPLPIRGLAYWWARRRANGDGAAR